ncbi:MAG: hypothetical protein PWQ88_572 [Candidatus Methanomethylophilaceae archaeon]|nr:hypothetical protein [Candidatus Methanomethylophilaceae archaeon]MDI3541593.1 hypothetical protein [Candidatus Methanomethylophilaceae archaeon]
MYDPYDMPYRSSGISRVRFSERELRDIAISVAVLTLAFTLVFIRWYPLYSDFVTNFLVWLGICLAIVLSGFVLHELGHKFAAQHYGAWAEYRMFPQGLILALLISLLGVLFAAPGAVYIRGMIDRRQNGIISLAGPGVNLIIGAVSLLLALTLSGTAGFVMYMLARINLILAVFNLIPFPPLDGSKILKWNPLVFTLAFVSGIVMFLLAY